MNQILQADEQKRYEPEHASHKALHLDRSGLERALYFILAVAHFSIQRKAVKPPIMEKLCNRHIINSLFFQKFGVLVSPNQLKWKHS